MTRVVIIGTGWYGLAAAKTYLQLFPETEVTIIETDNSVGGVWSKDRLYPNLYVQITYPFFEYYDIPMRPEGLTPEGYISGQTIHTYLQEYAEKFDLIRRIKFRTLVEHAQRNLDGTWTLSLKNLDSDSGSQDSITCDKLIVATGITSKPSIPEFPNQSFTAETIHSKDIGQNVHLLEDPKIQRVSVIGAAKSSYDAVYLAMKAGKQVDWIIRSTGAGGVNMFPSTYFGFLKTTELSSMRLTSKMSPSIMQTNDWWYTIFQRTWVGTVVTTLFWMTLTKLNDWYAGYGRSENAEKLRPQPANAMWCNNGLGCMSLGSNFWELFHAGGARVHKGEVDRLAGRSIFLKDGSEIPTDFTIFCTGWSDDTELFDRETTELLGLPGRDSGFVDESWKQKDEKANQRIDELFPLLRETPNAAPRAYAKKPQRAWKLYRRVAPPALASSGDRSVAIMGQIHTISTALLSGIQALWVVSYLEGKLELPDRETMEAEVAEWNAWSRKRYLDAGMKLPYSIFDFIPYVDNLCRDMGINPRRKSNFLTEHLSPYGPRDYSTLVEEWKSVHAKDTATANGEARIGYSEAYPDGRK